MLMFAVAVGTIPVLITMMSVRIKYRTPLWKLLILALVLVTAGFYGSRLMSLIESGRWGGRRFYGTVFFAPFVMILMARLLRLRVRDVLDQCAPPVGIMLMLAKFKCLSAGCCYGRLLHIGADRVVRFPSQIVESVSGLALAVALVIQIRNGRMRETAYPWCMILYGIIRSILHPLRGDLTYISGLPSGNFWSLISIAVGVLWILIHRKVPHKSERRRKC